ncbi:hypothetical protein [Niabella drilacis]|uniref:YD repeat-containing protein n=1 Tax=Niabella drilacis (strain DSM 25811 / CCM 8410 / CCUG 62505 / LMG 26954 / E90) TaxID=1285928 RepID=A0A1G6WJF8_NIADE|nr:hypothetical protein [Niabella drilacis]SDD65909.1 YD repeat-containing protein [Niabella drilacis]
MKKIIYCILSLLLFISSCKKNGENTSRNGRKKIASVKTDKVNTFIYDDERRLVRVNYGATDYRKIAYSPTGFTIQLFDAGNNPVAETLGAFNMVDGKVVSGQEAYDNNRELSHTYQYDAQGRLTQHTTLRLEKITHKKLETKKYYYSYEGNNPSRIIELSFNGENVRRDSAVTQYTYYEDKKFYTWADIGFDYFGTVPAAIDESPLRNFPAYNVLSTLPFNNAPKSSTSKRYRWDNAQQKWNYQSGSSGTVPEDLYQNDADGYLVKYSSADIVWQ